MLKRLVSRRPCIQPTPWEHQREVWVLTCFLLSANASFSTGSYHLVDGGYTDKFGTSSARNDRHAYLPTIASRDFRNDPDQGANLRLRDH